MDFIFMLTHHDRTVQNCLEVYDSLAGIGLRHVGFKDVGVDKSTLKELTRRIKADGSIAYVEVVSQTPETIRQSIKASAELGVDRVLGGQDIAHAMATFKHGGPNYYPFPGSPTGHPTKLGGTASKVEDDCRDAMSSGCPGVDLLAYRATEADPVDLIRAARRGLGDKGYLIVAGSIDSPARIKAVAAAGADAFTIGSAVFEDAFAQGIKGVRDQCKAVLRAVGT
jgi:indole-3-glycerol phosphate synthase